MPRIAFVNGQYVCHSRALVHIDDRGYQFADGVYEVILVEEGVPIDLFPHFERLAQSLKALSIAWPLTREGLKHHVKEIIRRNLLRRGIVYIQITRGVASRDHKFPLTRIKPSLVMTAKRLAPLPSILREKGAAVISLADDRWRHCDIKSISLLPNVLGKQKAVAGGAFEAWLIDENGYVTEGTSTNAWIVNHQGCICTRPLGIDILSGITRQMVQKITTEHQLSFEERPFSISEAVTAKEAFLTSTTSAVLPITSIDGAAVGTGLVGEVTRHLGALYETHIHAEIERART